MNEKGQLNFGVFILIPFGILCFALVFFILINTFSPPTEEIAEKYCQEVGLILYEKSFDNKLIQCTDEKPPRNVSFYSEWHNDLLGGRYLIGNGGES